MIARDGSEVEVIPLRVADKLVPWGYNINAVKLLEVAPCEDCFAVSNVHLLPNGDVSMDVSITHPFDDPQFTGFDVRGIIMFEGHRQYPDNELRIKAGLEPWNEKVTPMQTWSDHELGDAELMNPDGWTTYWSPTEYGLSNMDTKYMPTEFPIFQNFPGKYANCENPASLNAFRRFWSNENRQMFEVNKTVTRTYIIRPPAEGPILASYAVFAHWAPPLKKPVTNPALDFPDIANAPLPYEFWITQDAPLDPDKSMEENGSLVRWHVKFSTFPVHWTTLVGIITDTLYYYNGSTSLIPHPNGIKDDYWMPFNTKPYEILPGALPGECIYVFRVDMNRPPDLTKVGYDWQIKKIYIEAPDGE